MCDCMVHTSLHVYYHSQYEGYLKQHLFVMCDCMVYVCNIHNIMEETFCLMVEFRLLKCTK